MSHAIHGTGLVSPIGLTPREHAFYLPALLPPPAASPFVGPKDEPLPVKPCVWLGGSAPVGGRLAALAIQSARSALEPLASHPEVSLGLLFCADAARPGLTDADVRQAEEALVRVVSPAFVERVRSSGAPFGALDAALERARHARVDGLLVVAADSMISLELVTERYVTRRPGHWCGWPPAPSEAGAAALLVSPEPARRWSLRPVATLRATGIASGGARDDDDDIVDGVALTGLVRRLGGSRVHYVFGQGAVDDLRERRSRPADASEQRRLAPAVAARTSGSHSRPALTPPTWLLAVSVWSEGGVRTPWLRHLSRLPLTFRPWKARIRTAMLASGQRPDDLRQTAPRSPRDDRLGARRALDVVSGQAHGARVTPPRAAAQGSDLLADHLVQLPVALPPLALDCPTRKLPQGTPAPRAFGPRTRPPPARRGTRSLRLRSTPR